MQKDILSYYDLSDFTRGYVDAMFFTEEEKLREDYTAQGVEPMGEGSKINPTFENLAPSAKKAIIADCAGFEMLHKELLEKAYAQSSEYNALQAGHDFWLTRNEHGAGFWDRGLGDVGDQLTAFCGHGTKYPNCDIYLGDDGLIYISGRE